MQACNQYQASVTARWTGLRSGRDQQKVANQSAIMALSVLRDYLSIADQQALESLLMKAEARQTSEYRNRIRGLLEESTCAGSLTEHQAAVLQMLAELALIR